MLYRSLNKYLRVKRSVIVGLAKYEVIIIVEMFAFLAAAETGGGVSSIPIHTHANTLFYACYVVVLDTTCMRTYTKGSITPANQRQIVG